MESGPAECQIEGEKRGGGGGDGGGGVRLQRRR